MEKNTPEANEGFIKLYTKDRRNSEVEYSDQISPETISYLFYIALLKIPNCQIPMEIALKRFKTEIK